MLDKYGIPRIETQFDQVENAKTAKLYSEIIHDTLLKMLPEEFFIEKGDDLEVFDDVKKQFHDMLPLLSSSILKPGIPGIISFYLLSKYRANSFKFFFEMMSSWLVPGKRLNVQVFYAVDFTLPDISDDVYTLCEVMIHVDNAAVMDVIQRNLPIIGMEVRLGAKSAYYARRILEVKGFSLDEKTVLIQGHMAHLIQRLPQTFDNDLLTEMQHVIVICRDDFREAREAVYLSRIISVQYLFRKELRELVKTEPEKRHLCLKLFRSKQRIFDTVKPVVGILVGINFIKDKEIFEEKHLLKAVQNYVTNVEAVSGSFFVNRRGTENICTLYLEIMKSEGQVITDEEMQRVRNELPNDLKDRIEHMLHPVFMARNEEEVMRNILSLSNQIKFLRDIPQMFISFDEQDHQNLIFMVIIVRVVTPKSIPLQELLKSCEPKFSFAYDRTKIVGYLRKKYPKEADVFRVKMKKDQFLRGDNTIDLNKARELLVLSLTKSIGEIRDFNGGMITKQNELLCAVRNLVSDQNRHSDLLLENFFYSLTPIVMRTVLDPIALKHLFLMLLDMLEERFNANDYAFRVQRELDTVYVIIKSKSAAVKEILTESLNRLNLGATELATAFVTSSDTPFIGYIYRSDDPYKQEHFCQSIHYALEGIKPVYNIDDAIPPSFLNEPWGEENYVI